MLRILAGTGIEGEAFQEPQKGKNPKKHDITKNSPKNKSSYCCDKENHQVDECHYKNAKCNFCSKKGHTETTCLLKKRKRKIGSITAKRTSVVKIVHTPDRQPIHKSVYMSSRDYKF